MRRRRPEALLLTLGLAAWVAAACGSDAPTADLGGGCTLASDCTSPLICTFQLCHQQCSSDRDCSAGVRCVRSAGDGNVCQLPSERDCERTSDCPAGQVCAIDQQCRNSCNTPKDCTPGEVCVDGTCAKPDEIGPGGKLPQKGGDDGAPCRYDSECMAPRVCSHHECLYQCIADADCPIELRCVDNACEPVEPVCVPNQQMFCEPCGIKHCDEYGMWKPCDQEGCGGSGGGSSTASGPTGSGGASTTSGPGSSTASGTGGATSGSGSSTASGTGGATSGASSGPTTTTGSGGSGQTTGAGPTTTGAAGATATSTTAVTTTAVTTGAMSTGTSCMMCVEAGAPFGAGGDPQTRNLCCE